MINAKYMIGASMICVSVDTDSVYRAGDNFEITVECKKGDYPIPTYYEHCFEWVNNTFLCSIENLEPETQYTIRTMVIHNNTQVEYSDWITFETEPIGNCSYSMWAPMPGYEIDYTSSVEVMAQEIIGKLNAAGVQYGEIGFQYDCTQGTAAAGFHDRVRIGTRYAKNPSDYENKKTVTHELGHYFGNSAYNQSNLNLSRRFKDGVYFYGLNTSTVPLEWNPNYSVDDVHKFITGSDIAFVNLNAWHDSEWDGAKPWDTFRLRGHNREKVWIISNQDDADAMKAYKTTRNTILYSATSQEEIGGDVSNIAATLRRYGAVVTKFEGRDNMDSIQARMFEKNSNLSEITFEKGLGTVPYQAFFGTSKCSSIVFPEGTTKFENRSIDLSFRDLVDLPTTVTYIGLLNFENDKPAKLIIRATTPPSVSSAAAAKTFQNWTGTLYVPDESLAQYVLAYRDVPEGNIKPLSEF